MASKVKVYGKAQSRTALGIMHAYMHLHPNATIEDLRTAFPDSLNPDSGVKKNFVFAEEKGTDANWEGFFRGEDELLETGDGRNVAVVKMWTKPSFDRLVRQAELYGIEVARFEDADKGIGRKGGYSLEFLDNLKDNGKETDFISKVQKAPIPWWGWLIIAALALALIVIIFSFVLKASKVLIIILSIVIVLALLVLGVYIKKKFF